MPGTFKKGNRARMGDCWRARDFSLSRSLKSELMLENDVFVVDEAVVAGVPAFAATVMKVLLRGTRSNGLVVALATEPTA